jgi:hypothetical protein
MSAAVLSAVPAQAVRPVPWRQMLWVCWRRYRTALLASLALRLVIAVVLGIRGHQMREAYGLVRACSPAGSASCRFLMSTFRDQYGNIGALGALLVWLPAVIGAFAGAPQLARELETGTFRYTWTQGVGRTRWVVSLLGFGAVAVSLLAGVLGLVVSWYNNALVEAGFLQRLHPNMFPLTGVAVCAWALLGFALGALAGVLTRRVVPALAATLVVWTVLAAVVGNNLRDRYLPPLLVAGDQPFGAAQVDSWWQKGSTRLSDEAVDRVLQGIGVQTGPNGSVVAVTGRPNVDPFEYLTQHGYTQWTSYQPDRRYWPFQWIETGWLTLLSLALLGLTVWLVRRRSA